MMTTPLSADAASADPRPGINAIVPDEPSFPNPMGFTALTSGKKKK
jgi:hypothetical protein